MEHNAKLQIWVRSSVERRTDRSRSGAWACGSYSREGGGRCLLTLRLSCLLCLRFTVRMSKDATWVVHSRDLSSTAYAPAAHPVLQSYDVILRSGLVRLIVYGWPAGLPTVCCCYYSYFLVHNSKLHVSHYFSVRTNRLDFYFGSFHLNLLHERLLPACFSLNSQFLLLVNSFSTHEVYYFLF